MMNPERQTATIYMFPKAGAQRMGMRQPKSLEEVLASMPQACEFGSGWYHDEAIQDTSTKPNH